MKEHNDNPVFVSVEVKRIREFIDCEADEMGRDVLRRTLHQMLDRVCKADDEQYNSYRQHFEKQGGVMAATALQNVRLRKRVAALEEWLVKHCDCDERDMTCDDCVNGECPMKNREVKE